MRVLRRIFRFTYIADINDTNDEIKACFVKQKRRNQMNTALKYASFINTPFAVASHVGMLRKENEDSYAFDKELGLYIVADGMGGHENGKTASTIACKLVVEQVKLGKSVENAIKLAHLRIRQLSLEIGAFRGMGTTIVVLQFFDEQSAGVWWVGDSRLYLSTFNEIRLITKDHSRVQELIDNHIIDERSAKTHPQQHMITRCVGMSQGPSINVDYAHIDLHKNSRFLICSDGLSNELSQNEIQHMLCKETDIETKVNALITKSNEKGGRDNVTALIVDYI